MTRYEELTSRDPPGMAEALRRARIGIAGLGGLGSNVAMMLVRAGAEDLVVVDHDIVETSNLNRQCYFAEHVGMRKVDACEAMLHGINPDVRVEKHFAKLDASNIRGVFAGCEAVVEALDAASEKRMLIEAVCAGLPGAILVCGNGMAGCGDANAIRTANPFGAVVMCGDGVSDAGESGIAAPRVMVCAGHMADAIAEMLSKERGEWKTF